MSHCPLPPIHTFDKNKASINKTYNSPRPSRKPTSTTMSEDVWIHDIPIIACPQYFPKNILQHFPEDSNAVFGFISFFSPFFSPTYNERQEKVRWASLTLFRSIFIVILE
ncbi:hypothetical protein NPIL_267081 [Nephila pilipes]|uniref:Uncharacterized protein n=1 Tax=Nephila pilipes TaxID=299642 RepID=A0A8X6Q7V7_NEPPI|nr:hypothetical protein NPIL_267081 [Nephila pilipes]